MGGILGRRAWERSNGGLWLPTVYWSPNRMGFCCCEAALTCCGCTSLPGRDDLTFTFSGLTGDPYSKYFASRSPIENGVAYTILGVAGDCGIDCSYINEGLSTDLPVLTIGATSWPSCLYPVAQYAQVAISGTSLCVFLFNSSGLSTYVHIFYNDPVVISGDCSEFLDGYVVGDDYYTNDPSLDLSGASVTIGVSA